MPNKPNNPPAFSRPYSEASNGEFMPAQTGMTLLDYTATKAMQSLIREYTDNQFVVKRAFDIAELMLVEREKRMQ